MPSLRFEVESVTSMPESATPVLLFRLRIFNTPAEEQIHSISLNVQLQIQPGRRHYAPAEQSAMNDLFGEPARWSTTLRPLFWTSASATVPGFAGSTIVDLRVPCTFDFNVAATKYFHGVQEGEIPVALLFNGTVFYISDNAIQVALIPWSQETSCRVSAGAWKEMMARHYPDSSWLSLQHEAFERLYRYKVQHGLPTWEQTVDHVLAAASERKP
ncbi:MAG TPA: DUF6084 family protein [Terriglobales bacterium]|nr:DUF6084 family protein [Terriglobales bacterium]